MRKINTTIILALAIMAAACSDAPAAQKALAGAGYTNIQIHGWGVLGCSEDDQFRTKFTAIGPTGVQVTGVVCSGWLKGATIRTN